MGCSDSGCGMLNPFDPGYFGSEELRSFGFARVGREVQIARNCTIIGLRNIAIGDYVRIDACTTLIGTGPMTFGNRIHIGGHCHFVAVEPLEFGDFAGTSQGVRIYTASDDYSGRALMGPMVPPEYRCPTCRPISLGRYAVIGANSVLLPGAQMAEGSALGAQSLTAKAMEPWSVYFGAPAKRIKSRSRHCTLLAAELDTSLNKAA
jgi:acetyltransferase-like isoleucine patch superfamily enzyme